MSKSQRDKGKRGERDVVRRLKADLGLEAHRGAPLQAAHGGLLPDVVVPRCPWMWIEVSYGKRPSPHRKMAQAQAATGLEIPIIITRRDREEPIVSMQWGEWVHLMRDAGHGGRG